jgi:zinc/manganese transport system substrate-binding protein
MPRLSWILLVLWLALGVTAARAAGGVPVVAAESVYGDVARQIGGDAITVTSLISNPAQDPHLFEASPAAARALADARIAIANGADYDGWFTTLLASAPRPARIEIVVAKLIGRKPGDNPHLWYDPRAMPAFAKAFAAALATIDPSHKGDYETRLAAFLASLQPIEATVAAMHKKYKSRPVTATEPVFGPMTEAIELTNRNQHFQLAMMNGTEPSAHDLAEFERDLKEHKVKVLISNTQVNEPLSRRFIGLAQAAGVPVVGVTETLPAGEHYQDWVMRELDALDRALGGSR